MPAMMSLAGAAGEPLRKAGRTSFVRERCTVRTGAAQYYRAMSTWWWRLHVVVRTGFRDYT